MYNLAAARVAILAVDDTPANLVAMEAIVDGLGHELVGVRSGLEALSVAATREFAAILLDVTMPGVDGFETLKRLRAISAAQGTPVIFLTAHRFDESMARRAYELGAVDYLEKPIASDLLRGKLSSFVALFQQRKEIHRQDEALRIKDRHICILAHDLRSPLATALQGARHLQNQGDLTVRVVADRIARSLMQLEQLTADLLASARSATSMRLRPQRFELSSLVQELVDDFSATYPSVRFSTALACDVLGTWDPSRVQQALSNLLGNAVKYGSGWVSLETRCTPQGASIIVENGGARLSPEQLASLFEPARAAQGRPGAGLGLFIAKEIARAHAGELRAESDAKSTRFILQLPR
jgi:signal transduction histidine kinase